MYSSRTLRCDRSPNGFHLCADDQPVHGFPKKILK
jgi:hypothetical protein